MSKKRGKVDGQSQLRMGGVISFSDVSPSSLALASASMSSAANRSSMYHHTEKLKENNSSSSSSASMAPVYSGNDSELAMVSAKLSKKDPTTKVKALRDIACLLRTRDEHVASEFLPFFVRIYTKLSLDDSHAVRELLSDVIESVCSVQKQLLAPHMKRLIGRWWMLVGDPVSEVSEKAYRVFTSAVPPKKRPQVLLYLSPSILSDAMRNSKLSANPTAMMDSDRISKEDAQEKCERIFVSTLKSLNALIVLLDKEGSNDTLLTGVRYEESTDDAVGRRQKSDMPDSSSSSSSLSPPVIVRYSDVINDSLWKRGLSDTPSSISVSRAAFQLLSSTIRCIPAVLCPVRDGDTTTTTVEEEGTAGDRIGVSKVVSQRVVSSLKASNHLFLEEVMECFVSLVTAHPQCFDEEVAKDFFGRMKTLLRSSYHHRHHPTAAVLSYVLSVLGCLPVEHVSVLDTRRNVGSTDMLCDIVADVMSQIEIDGVDSDDVLREVLQHRGAGHLVSVCSSYVSVVQVVTIMLLRRRQRPMELKEHPISVSVSSDGGRPPVERSTGVLESLLGILSRSVVVLCRGYIEVACCASYQHRCHMQQQQQRHHDGEPCVASISKMEEFLFHYTSTSAAVEQGMMSISEQDCRAMGNAMDSVAQSLVQLHRASLQGIHLSCSEWEELFWTPLSHLLTDLLNNSSSYSRRLDGDGRVEAPRGIALPIDRQVITRVVRLQSYWQAIKQLMYPSWNNSPTDNCLLDSRYASGANLIGRDLSEHTYARLVQGGGGGGVIVEDDDDDDDDLPVSTSIGLQCLLIHLTAQKPAVQRGVVCESLLTGWLSASLTTLSSSSSSSSTSSSSSSPSQLVVHLIHHSIMDALDLTNNIPSDERSRLHDLFFKHCMDLQSIDGFSVFLSWSSAYSSMITERGRDIDIDAHLSFHPSVCEWVHCSGMDLLTGRRHGIDLIVALRFLLLVCASDEFNDTSIAWIEVAVASFEYSHEEEDAVVGTTGSTSGSSCGQKLSRWFMLNLLQYLHPSSSSSSLCVSLLVADRVRAWSSSHAEAIATCLKKLFFGRIRSPIDFSGRSRGGGGGSINTEEKRVVMGSSAASCPAIVMTTWADVLDHLIGPLMPMHMPMQSMVCDRLVEGIAAVLNSSLCIDESTGGGGDVVVAGGGDVAVEVVAATNTTKSNLQPKKWIMHLDGLFRIQSCCSIITAAAASSSSKAESSDGADDGVVTAATPRSSSMIVAVFQESFWDRLISSIVEQTEVEDRGRGGGGIATASVAVHPSFTFAIQSLALLFDENNNNSYSSSGSSTYCIDLQSILVRDARLFLSVFISCLLIDQVHGPSLPLAAATTTAAATVRDKMIDCLSLPTSRVPTSDVVQFFSTLLGLGRDDFRIIKTNRSKYARTTLLNLQTCFLSTLSFLLSKAMHVSSASPSRSSLRLRSPSLSKDSSPCEKLAPGAFIKWTHSKHAAAAHDDAAGVHDSAATVRSAEEDMPPMPIQQQQHSSTSCSSLSLVPCQVIAVHKEAGADPYFTVQCRGEGQGGREVQIDWHKLLLSRSKEDEDAVDYVHTYDASNLLDTQSLVDARAYFSTHSPGYHAALAQYLIPWIIDSIESLLVDVSVGSSSKDLVASTSLLTSVVVVICRYMEGASVSHRQAFHCHVVSHLRGLAVYLTSFNSSVTQHHHLSTVWKAGALLVQCLLSTKVGMGCGLWLPIVLHNIRSTIPSIIPRSIQGAIQQKQQQQQQPNVRALTSHELICSVSIAVTSLLDATLDWDVCFDTASSLVPIALSLLPSPVPEVAIRVIELLASVWRHQSRRAITIGHKSNTQSNAVVNSEWETEAFDFALFVLVEGVSTCDMQSRRLACAALHHCLLKRSRSSCWTMMQHSLMIDDKYYSRLELLAVHCSEHSHTIIDESQLIVRKGGRRQMVFDANELCSTMSSSSSSSCSSSSSVTRDGLQEVVATVRLTAAKVLEAWIACQPRRVIEQLESSSSRGRGSDVDVNRGEGLKSTMEEQGKEDDEEEEDDEELELVRDTALFEQIVGATNLKELQRRLAFSNDALRNASLKEAGDWDDKGGDDDDDDDTVTTVGELDEGKHSKSSSSSSQHRKYSKKIMLSLMLNSDPLGSVLLWLLCLQHIETKSAQNWRVRMRLVNYLKRAGSQCNVMTAVMMLLLHLAGDLFCFKDVTNLLQRIETIDDDDVHRVANNSRSSSSSSSSTRRSAIKTNDELSISVGTLQHLAIYAIFRTICTLPAMFRTFWSDDCNRVHKMRLSHFIEDRVRSSLIGREMFLIAQASAAGRWKTDEFEVKGSLVSGEVTAVLKSDETSIEIRIKLPSSYPLKNVDVSCTSRIGVSDGRWRRWVLQMIQLLSMQDGSLVDAVLMWKLNIEKELKGVEPCPICYSTLHIKTHCLPALSCPTCHNKFHSPCLYTWFKSSGKSKCVICQQPFFT